MAVTKKARVVPKKNIIVEEGAKALKEALAEKAKEVVEVKEKTATKIVVNADKLTSDVLEEVDKFFKAQGQRIYLTTKANFAKHQKKGWQMALFNGKPIVIPGRHEDRLVIFKAT